MLGRVHHWIIPLVATAYIALLVSYLADISFWLTWVGIATAAKINAMVMDVADRWLEHEALKEQGLGQESNESGVAWYKRALLIHFALVLVQEVSLPNLQS